MNTLDMYTPTALTHAVNKTKPETLYLSRTLGVKPPKFSAAETVMFDVVDAGRRDLAPMGHNGDPATRVDYAEGMSTYTVAPPQVFLEDTVKASDVTGMRMAGMSPVMVGSGQSAPMLAAFNQYIGTKQSNMRAAITRRVEWMWAQMLTTGKVDYRNPEGRRFTVDCHYNEAVCFKTLSKKWGEADAEPLLQLQQLQREFQEANGMNPTVFLVGREAADVFRANKSIQGWLKSAGVQLLQVSQGSNADLVTPIASVPGVGQLVEYSARYVDGGSPTPYIPDKALVMTNPYLFQMHYGAIIDFDLGANPILMAEYFSKLKDSRDGKAKSLFVESHPLPVAEYDTAAFVVTVC